MSSSSNDRSFWPAFQKRWAALLCDQTEGLSAWSEAMTRALGRGVIEVPNSADAHAALDHLNERLARLESVRQNAPVAPLDAATRAHFVRYGASLLSAPAPAIKIELGYGDVRLRVEELCEWLRLLKLVPRQVFSLEDFDSQIIGRAIALQLSVSFQIADSDSYTRSKSLIVSADGRNLTAAQLRIIFPGQVLYAFNLCHQIGCIVPDVASIVASNLSLPWRQERAFAREIAGLTERIASAPLRPSEDDWNTRVEFYRARRTLLTAGASSLNRMDMLPETL